MKSIYWAMLAAFVFGIPIGYGGMFLVGAAIDFAMAKAAPPPVTIFYVERVVPRPNPSAPPSNPQAVAEGALR